MYPNNQWPVDYLKVTACPVHNFHRFITIVFMSSTSWDLYG